MTYQDFNLIVHEKILERADDVFFNLHFEQQDFPDQKFDFKELQEDWGSLMKAEATKFLIFLTNSDSIHCSKQYETDEEGHNSKQYQIRLVKLLQLDDVNHLQRLFEGPDPAAPAQERIWREAQRHLGDGQGVLTLPENKKFKDRYIQFPKSQVLLNREDLKQFTPFFAEEFRWKEQISFDFYREIVMTIVLILQMKLPELKQRICF